MNVVLYFKRIRDVRKFSIVSKNCHEAIKGMKINPIMNYAKKLKYRKVYASLIFRLFPNIQTIQIPDYSYPIPNEIVSKLSFIRLLNKMNLTEGRIHRNKIENEPPTFEVTDLKYFHYDIHEKYMLKNKPIDTTNQSYYHSLGNEIHTEINDEIISKLQEYEIYSYETVIEIKTKNTIENEYNLLIFAILSRIKTLKSVYIHSCKAIINNDYINYIESYPFIKFTFIIYTFIQNQHEIYIKLKSMFNVQLIFHCFHPLFFYQMDL
ncbi:Leucine-rich repeat containing protein [Entamoeba marina]